MYLIFNLIKVVKGYVIQFRLKFCNFIPSILHNKYAQAFSLNWAFFEKYLNQVKICMKYFLTLSKMPNQVRILVYTLEQAFSLNWVYFKLDRGSKYIQLSENACSRVLYSNILY